VDLPADNIEESRTSHREHRPLKLWEQKSHGPPSQSGPQSTRWILWSRDGESPLTPKRGEDSRRGGPPTKAGEAPDAPGRPAARPLPRQAEQSYRNAERRAALAHPEPGPSGWDAGTIGRIIDERRIGVAFQPVLDIAHDQIVGFEALARGPEGPLHRPAALFAAARSIGRAGELDWAIRALAFRTLMAADVHPTVSLFVNVAPDSLIESCPDDLLPDIWEAETRLRVFVDIDGRSALRHPRAVLESVRRARAAGWGVSLDDIGYSATSMAFLPVLEPDVVRLDHRLLTAGIALGEATLTAALGEAERSGATLVIGNIEDSAGTAEARSVGAEYQQGWFHGREMTELPSLPDPVAAIPMLPNRETSGLCPWDLLQEAGARMMLDIPREAAGNTARQLLGELLRLPQRPVVALVLPHGYSVPADVAAMKRVLLADTPLALVMGAAVDHHDDWRARTAHVPADHALADQGCIVAMSGTVTMAVAFRHSSGGPAGRWDLATTQNPTVVRRVMRELMHHADRLAGGVVANLEAAVSM
jgi:EAL domain-containing protein (putative c-di-GMP-specific phosphodiesterase class I)